MTAEGRATPWVRGGVKDPRHPPKGCVKQPQRTSSRAWLRSLTPLRKMEKPARMPL
jgi:hypothetical protein